MLNSSTLPKKQKVKFPPAKSEGIGHNQCPTCGEEFSSLSAFDKHRTGEYGSKSSPRRCMSPKEMQAKGMVLRGNNQWITKEMASESLSEIKVS